MPYLSDRQRVELALPARLLIRPAQRCAEEWNGDDSEILTQLENACYQPLEGLDPIKKAKVAKRINRIQKELLSSFENRPVMVVFLTIIYWLNDLLEREIIVLDSNSDFAKACETLFPMLNEHSELIDGMSKSAEKNARRFNEKLNKGGYYNGG
ncbi:hypothetical protein [uncultured Kiloniella sp.]|uniref:hypothetical protein n=1 Tax=uncultured Kiloniella sp. TaxID=1133091 RepID=UPI0026349999|nr:hypothetical protein [uncultured Kiloniella sp.]